MAYGGRAVTFNSYDLQTSTVSVTSFPDIDDVANIENNYIRLATTDGQKVVETKYGGRRITLIGYIFGTSIANIEATLDTFKSNIVRGLQSNLDIAYAGGTRRWEAKVDNIDFGGRNAGFGGITRQFVITFSTLGFGFATSSTTVSYANETGSPTKTIAFTGSAKALPKYTITVNSETDLSNIKIKAVDTNREIEIAQAFSASDVIVVDTEAKTVTVNGTGVEPQGVFPEVIQGTNDITFTLTSSSHDVDIDVEYTARYL